MRVSYRGRPVPALNFSPLCDLRMLSVNGCFSSSIEISPCPRGPRARRLLVYLARDLSSLTPSSRASLLARLLSTVIPFVPAHCHVSCSLKHQGRAHCMFCRRSRRVVGRMQVCWAVVREEALGRGSFAVWVVFFLRVFCVPTWSGSYFFVQVVRFYTIAILQVLDGAFPTSDESGLRAGAGVPGLESLLSIERRPASDKHFTLPTLIKLQAYP
jgi:hypothetical protein